MSTHPIRSLCITTRSDRPEAETFIGLKAHGIDVRVRCEADAQHNPRLREAGVPVEPLHFSGKLDKAAIATIRRDLDEHQPDILHLFNNRAMVNGLIAARGRKIKIVAYRGIVGNESFLNPFSWMRYLNPRVDRIVCVAEAVRRHFLQMRCLWLTVPRDKPVTIYKGHDLSWYDATPADLGEFGVAPGDFVICCVANWRPRKGIEVLVDAFGQLPTDANIHLLLVGTMDNPALLRQIEACPGRERIHLAGFRYDAPALVAACDSAVLPSTKREGLPKTVIEAMAYGVPPVVTDCGGSPELIVNGESGLVVPVRDAPALAAAFSKLYEDREYRQRMGQAARTRIERHFRIEDTISQTLALYRALAGTGPDR